MVVLEQLLHKGAVGLVLEGKPGGGDVAAARQGKMMCQRQVGWWVAVGWGQGRGEGAGEGRQHQAGSGRVKGPCSPQPAPIHGQRHGAVGEQVAACSACKARRGAARDGRPPHPLGFLKPSVTVRTSRFCRVFTLSSCCRVAGGGQGGK